MNIILASTSSGRKQLMDRLGIKYKIMAPEFEEIVDPKKTIPKQVRDFALGKAISVLKHFSKSKDVLIIGCDSVAILKGKMIGKAHSRQDAKKTLKNFVGKEQTFLSCLAVIGYKNGKYFELQGKEETKITFRKDITDKEIETYLDWGEYQGKAGSYTVSGMGIFLIEKIQGDFHNIIGLPLRRLGKMIRQITGKSVWETVNLTPRKRNNLTRRFSLVDLRM